jgi:hypothetical protein
MNEKEKIPQITDIIEVQSVITQDNSTEDHTEDTMTTDDVINEDTNTVHFNDHHDDVTPLDVQHIINNDHRGNKNTLIIDDIIEEQNTEDNSTEGHIQEFMTTDDVISEDPETVHSDDDVICLNVHQISKTDQMGNISVEYYTSDGVLVSTIEIIHDLNAFYGNKICIIEFKVYLYMQLCRTKTSWRL